MERTEIRRDRLPYDFGDDSNIPPDGEPAVNRPPQIAKQRLILTVILHDRCHESVEILLAKVLGFAQSQYAIGSRCTTRIAEIIQAARIASIAAGDPISRSMPDGPPTPRQVGRLPRYVDW
jgi:hypothetical protein